MTFDQWWATFETREQQRADKEFTREAFEAGAASRDSRKGYAGVTMWIGDAAITRLIAKPEIDHEIEHGSTITNASQHCLDELAEAIRARSTK